MHKNGDIAYFNFNLNRYNNKNAIQDILMAPQSCCLCTSYTVGF